MKVYGKGSLDYAFGYVSGITHMMQGLENMHEHKECPEEAKPFISSMIVSGLELMEMMKDSVIEDENNFIEIFNKKSIARSGGPESE